MDDASLGGAGIPENAPTPTPEQIPTQPMRPELAPPTPERKVEEAPSAERTPAPAQGAPVTPAPQPAPPVQPAPAPVSAAKDNDDDNPAVADDVDVLEMEWVNKAKKIINDTKDDPHAQEQQVERLQRDYLKKRYGKELKAA